MLQIRASNAECTAMDTMRALTLGRLVCNQFCTMEQNVRGLAVGNARSRGYAPAYLLSFGLKPEEQSEGPNIFLTLYLGGFVVKSECPVPTFDCCSAHRLQVLNLSHLSTAQDNPVDRQIFLSAHAIFSFSVPHQGGHANAVVSGGLC